MTAEQLEELLSDLMGDDVKKSASAFMTLLRESPSLARRVICADRLIRAYETCRIEYADDEQELAEAEAAYREASK